MVLVLSESNCTLLNERLKSGQNCIENQPTGTPEGLISRTRLKNSRWTWNFGILHKSTWRLCVPILSEIGRPSFPSLPRSLRQKLLIVYVMYQGWRTVFVHISKQRDEKYKYDAKRSNFDELRSVWNGYHCLECLIYHQLKLKRNRKNKC